MTAIRLAIAGMDLYQHPAERYPGDPMAVTDGYARRHSTVTDLAFVQAALTEFERRLRF